MLLFGAGAAVGDVGLSLLLAGATFGDVGASLLVAGAAFGDVGLPLFVAGAAFPDILVDSQRAKCCIFPYKMRLQDGMGKVSGSGGCEMTILSSDSRRIMLALPSNRLYIGGSNSEIFRGNLELRISWQAQYLVKLEGDSCRSAHCTGRFI